MDEMSILISASKNYDPETKQDKYKISGSTAAMKEAAFLDALINELRKGLNETANKSLISIRIDIKNIF